MEVEERGECLGWGKGGGVPSGFEKSLDIASGVNSLAAEA